MLFQNFKPDDETTLYHYCSADTFLAICQGKKIRFTDLNSMNDADEMKWGYSIWEAAATKLYPVVGRDFLDSVDEILHNSGYRALSLIACFSKSADILSQWRAYGADGQGYAIGFNASSLSKMAATSLEVLYDKEKQTEEIHDMVAAIHFLESTRAHPRGPEFIDSCFRLYLSLIALKNPGFAEENEVRLLHVLDLTPSNNSFKLVDPGGSAFGTYITGSPLGFLMRENCPVPYLDQSFFTDTTSCAITEVILGPKNHAIPSGISIFLETVGLPSVQIKKSSLPYR